MKVLVFGDSDSTRVLSRVENLPVALVTYPGAGAHAQSAKARALRQQFFSDVRQAADAHHFTWVDTNEVFATHARGEKVHGLDGLHYNELGHQILGEVVAEAILDSVSVKQA